MYFWLEILFHVVFHCIFMVHCISAWLRLVLQLYVISLIYVSAALVILSIDPLLIIWKSENYNKSTGHLHLCGKEKKWGNRGRFNLLGGQRGGGGALSIGVSPDSWVQQWVRVHKARVRVRVRVHQARFRVHKVWIRVLWTRVRVRVHWTRVRVRVRVQRVRVRVRFLSPDSAWTHESNNRTVLYFNPTLNIFAELCIDK